MREVEAEDEIDNSAGDNGGEDEIDNSAGDNGGEDEIDNLSCDHETAVSPKNNNHFLSEG